MNLNPFKTVQIVPPPAPVFGGSWLSNSIYGPKNTGETFTQKRAAAKLDADSKHKPANSGSPWTDDDDIELADLYGDNLTIKELSEHFGRSIKAIRSRLNKIGIWED